MIKVNEPHSHYSVGIVDNEYFMRNRNYIIDLEVDSKGVASITVNGRKLQPYEWETKEACYYITLKDWA
jgi:hypothetical protein